MNLEGSSSKPIVLIVLGMVVTIGAYFSTIKRFATPPVISQPASEMLKPGVDTGSTAVPIHPDLSNWKLYQNERYGFEVKYPADFYVTAESDDLQSASMQLAVDLSKYKSPPLREYDGVRINVGQFSGNFEKYLEEFIKHNVEVGNDVFGDHVSMSEITKTQLTIDGITGYKVIGLPGVWSSDVEFTQNDKIFSIHNSIDDKLFDQILSTFRFIRSTSIHRST